MGRLSGFHKTIGAVFFTGILGLYSCQSKKEVLPEETPFFVVLGIAQDAGFPQAACQKACCSKAWVDPSLRKKVVSLGLIDPVSNEKWLFEATPDFKDQIQILNQFNEGSGVIPDGIFITHAHIGHYTGLMHLGREAIGSQKTPVYTMPRMRNFLRFGGPWSQLVKLNNISLHPVVPDSTIVLNKRIKVVPFLVPHRDEFSETVGYQILGPSKKIIFIPDIDKWEKWDQSILEMIEENDCLLLDGSFYANGEIPNRDMSEIPHPFIEESMDLFKNLPQEEKEKIHFIHFNHTNPVLNSNSEAYKDLYRNGFRIAEENQIIKL